MINKIRFEVLSLFQRMIFNTFFISSSSSSSSRRPQVREELAGLPLNSGHRFRNLSSLHLNTSTDPDSTISSGSLFQSFAIRLMKK